MATDPMEPIKVLGQRVVEEMTKLGLSVENFAVLPNFGSGPHMAQIVVSFEADAVEELVEKDDETKAMDLEFKEIMKAEKKAEEAEKLVTAEESLRRLAEELEKGTDGGLLG